MVDRLSITDLIALLRVRRAMRTLQRLMRERADPGGEMSCEEFEDRALREIDNDEVNQALEDLEAYVSRTTSEYDRPRLH